MSELPPLTPADLEAARARTKASGTKLRHRRRLGILAGSAVAVAALLVAGVAIAQSDDDRDFVELVDDPESTTTTERDRPTSTTTSTATSTTSAPTADVTTTAGGQPGAPGTPTPTSPPPPRDRFCVTVTGEGAEPRPDWAEFWQTQPAYNDPVTLDLCVADTTIAAGERAEFTITVSDPDAEARVDYPNRQGCNGPYDCYLSIGTDLDWARRPPQQGTPVEPQPTPPEVPGSASRTLSVPFDAPGSYSVIVLAQTSHREIVQLQEPCPGCSPGPGWLVNPYQSTVDTIVTITVT